MLPAYLNTLKLNLAKKYFSLLNFLNKSSATRLSNYILFFFLFLFLVIVCCNHYFLRTFTYDYGAYNFAFNDYAHLHNNLSTVYQFSNFKFLQDHVSFTLILFVPLYWLLSWLTGTYTLLIIQVLFIIFGGWAVFKLLELKTPNKIIQLAGLLYYFLILGRWTSFVNDCNLAIIASACIPIFIYYFEKKNWLLTMAAFAFILLSREDMALWTFFIGLFLLITHWKEIKLRNISVVIMVLSIVYFVFVFKFLIPLLESPEKSYTLFNYTALGKNPGEAFVFMFQHPVKSFLLLFQNQSGNPAYDYVKFEFYWVYLLSGGLLVFLRPRFLILFIPIIAKKMFNDDPIRWSIELYYSIEFVSLLPVVVFLIIASLKNTGLQNKLALTVCLVTVVITAVKFETSNHKLPWWNNRKYAFYKASMYKPEKNLENVHQYLKLIPAEARVSASNSILPQLSFRSKIYFFPRVDDAEYIALVRKNDSYPYSQEQFDAALNNYLTSSDWNVVVNESLIIILKKEKNLHPISVAALDSISSDTLFSCDAEKMLVGSFPLQIQKNIQLESGFLQSADKSHMGKYSIKLTKESPFAITLDIKNLEYPVSFEISGWRSSTEGTGVIVMSGRNPKYFYNTVQKASSSDVEGWELLKKSITLTEEIPGNELLVYLWNNGNAPVYFDDFKIIRKN